MKRCKFCNKPVDAENKFPNAEVSHGICLAKKIGMGGETKFEEIKRIVEKKQNE